MAKGFALIPSNLTVDPSTTNGYVIQNGALSQTGRYLMCGSTSLLPFYNFTAYSDSVINYYVVAFSSIESFVFRSTSTTSTATARRDTLYTTLDYYDVVGKYFATGISGYGLAAIADYDPYSSLDEAIADILSEDYCTIGYDSGVSAVAGPKLVLEGSTVTAYVTAPSGVTVTESDISISKNGTTLPFTYSNGVLTFTA